MQVVIFHACTCTCSCILSFTYTLLHNHAVNTTVTTSTSATPTSNQPDTRHKYIHCTYTSQMVPCLQVTAETIQSCGYSLMAKVQKEKDACMYLYLYIFLYFFFVGAWLTITSLSLRYMYLVIKCTDNGPSNVPSVTTSRKKDAVSSPAELLATQV